MQNVATRVTQIVVMAVYQCSRPLMPRPRRLDGTDRVRIVIAQVKSDLRRQWTVREMAGMLGISESQLRRIFAEGGLGSPRQIVGELRLHAAAELLRDPTIQVKEVLARVGVSDASHFCRAFKRRFGLSPTAYRSSRTSVRESAN